MSRRGRTVAGNGYFRASAAPPSAGAILPQGCALKTPRETLIMLGLQTGRRH